MSSEARICAHIRSKRRCCRPACADRVLVEVDDGGNIARVAPGADRGRRRRIAGIALPGLPNLHCHAFQKGMAGLAERRGPAQ